MSSPALTVAIVVGVTPDKWVRRWRERFPEHSLDVVVVDDEDQVAVLHDGRARMAFARLPVDRTGLHLIPLWSEVEVAVLPREHPLAEFDALERADLDEEVVLEGLAPKVAVETVAAGTGIVFLPMSVARAHHRKDVVAVAVTDLPETGVGLAWRVDDEDPLLEQFIGIVRGRTERSSRGSTPSPASREKAPARKKPARQHPRRRR